MTCPSGFITFPRVPVEPGAEEGGGGWIEAKPKRRLYIFILKYED